MGCGAETGHDVSDRRWINRMLDMASHLTRVTICANSAECSGHSQFTAALVSDRSMNHDESQPGAQHPCLTRGFDSNRSSLTVCVHVSFDATGV
jgi:hypothetical protein